MRRAAKVDENQARIVEVARRAGASVAHTYQLGSGYPDVTIGVAGFNLLWEIKTDGGQLTGREVEFHTTWRGQVDIVRTPEQAISLISKWRQLGEWLKEGY